MKDFDQLISELTEKARTAPRMVQAMVELTYGCNLRCVHCYNPTHLARNELTTPQVCRLLDQLVDQGCLWVGFTGGELFTRRDTGEILRYAKSLGLVISLITNATMITPDLADLIGSLNVYQVDVSVYGATAETYQAVTRIPGSFSAFVQGVGLLAARRIPVMLKLVMMTLNVHELEKMQQFAATRGMPYKISTEIHPKVDGSREPLTYRLAPDQAFEVWRKTSGEGLRQNPQGREEGRCGNAGKLFDCLCGKSNAAITPHGKMNLCLSIYHPLFDVSQGNVAEGWEQLVRVVAETEPGPAYECERCSVAQHCTRGSMDGWLEHQAFDAPCIPYFREVAGKKEQFLAEAFAV